MHIPKTEMVVRYLVKFDKRETEYLRQTGFLHPHCEELSEMWMTEEEFQVFYKIPIFQKEVLDSVLRRAKDERAGKEHN